MSTSALQTEAPAAQRKFVDGLSWRWQIPVFLAAFFVIVLRRPDAVLHAQFYGEDGAIWYAQAYNYGAVHATFFPYAGYFHLLPRLAAAFALLAPFAYAPLVENAIAIAAEALPVCLLLSSRSKGWGSLRFRAVLAAAYLVVPNSREIIGSVTESQWILALCALLALLSSPPENNRERFRDLALLLLCGLTGPFCLILLPIAIYLRWQQPWAKWKFAPIGVLSFCAAVQFTTLLLTGAARHRHLGASPAMLAQIVAGPCYLSTLLGGGRKLTSSSVLAAAVIAIAITTLLVLRARWAGAEMRTMLVFTAIVLACSLLSPTGSVSPPMTPWGMLELMPGSRYEFFPALLLVWSILWCVHRPPQIFQIIGTLLLAVLSVGIVRDFRYHPFPDVHLREHVLNLEHAPSGAQITIPETPEGWNVNLIKH